MYLQIIDRGVNQKNPDKTVWECTRITIGRYEEDKKKKVRVMLAQRAYEFAPAENEIELSFDVGSDVGLFLLNDAGKTIDHVEV